MVAVSNPARYGLYGGGKMWENPDEFDEHTEAYTVSVMHHLHCLVSDIGSLDRNMFYANLRHVFSK